MRDYRESFSLTKPSSELVRLDSRNKLLSKCALIKVALSIFVLQKILSPMLALLKDVFFIVLPLKSELLNRELSKLEFLIIVALKFDDLKSEFLKLVVLNMHG